MADYMTLMGAELVQSAGVQIARAAESMRDAAGSTSEAGRAIAGAADDIRRSSCEMADAVTAIGAAVGAMNAGLAQHQAFLDAWLGKLAATIAGEIP